MLDTFIEFKIWLFTLSTAVFLINKEINIGIKSFYAIMITHWNNIPWFMIISMPVNIM